MELLRSYANETDYTVWADVSTNFSTIARLFAQRGSGVQQKLDAYAIALYEGVATRLGWEARPDESHLDSMLRALVIGALGKAGHKVLQLENSDRDVCRLMHVAGHSGGGETSS